MTSVRFDHLNGQNGHIISPVFACKTRRVPLFSLIQVVRLLHTLGENPDQLLRDERIFGVMQNMVAKMVWKKFQTAQP